MKKYLAIILAAVMFLGILTLAGCSKKNGGGAGSGGEGESTEPVAASSFDVPDGYEQITVDNNFYGFRVTAAFPTFEKAEGENKKDGEYSYKAYTSEADYHCYNVKIRTNVTTDYGKESAYGESSGTVETIDINGLEVCKHSGYTSLSGEAIEYEFFIPFMDGFANLYMSVDYINEDLTADQWAEVVKAAETYTTFEILDTNSMTQDGKVVDVSGTMAFPNPSTIAGQSVELVQTARMNSMIIKGEFTVDGIPYIIYAEGTVSDSVYNSRKENTEDYTEVASGDYTFYAHMINRFPNVECELYTEIGGLYYEFYIYRNHKVETPDENKAFVDDLGNYQIFADMTADMINGADINADNYRG